jgi:hypothetical protein
MNLGVPFGILGIVTMALIGVHDVKRSFNVITTPVGSARSIEMKRPAIFTFTILDLLTSSCLTNPLITTV